MKRFIAGALLGLLAAAAVADDAAAMFDPSGKTSGAWSYGWRSPKNDFTPMVARSPEQCGYGLQGFACAGKNIAFVPVPSINRNDTGAELILINGSRSVTDWDLNALYLRQGIDGEWPVVRWTPAAGCWRLSGTVANSDVAAQGLVVFQFTATHSDGSVLAVKDLPGAAHFRRYLSMTQGSYVDFEVRVLSGGAFFADTELRVWANASSNC